MLLNTENFSQDLSHSIYILNLDKGIIDISEKKLYVRKKTSHYDKFHVGFKRSFGYPLKFFEVINFPKDAISFSAAGNPS